MYYIATSKYIYMCIHDLSFIINIHNIVASIFSDIFHFILFPEYAIKVLYYIAHSNSFL